MTLFVGGIGWGLLAFGAITHVWHHDRLRHLLGLHLDRDRSAAAALTLAELIVAVGLPVAVLMNAWPARPLAIAAGLLAVVFAIWIVRLLATGSELPCACSFAETPTTLWSLGRAAATVLVVALALDSATTVDTSAALATLTVALAVAGAIFVLPEALSWPEPSRASLARIDAHAPEPAASVPL